MTELVPVLLLSFLGSVLGLLGGVVMMYVKPWTKALTVYSVPFAAGVLLTVSLVGLLPEAHEMIGELAFWLVLASFIATYLFEQFFVQIHHHDGEDTGLQIPSILVVVGDTIHNAIDGMAIAATYISSPGLGTVTAISTFLHEVPHEIGDFGIMLKAGWSKARVVMVNLFSALTTFVGAGLVLVFVPDQRIVGGLIAVAAGMFLYLGASDFLPNAAPAGSSKGKILIAFLFGVMIMYLSMMLVPHGHE